MKVSLNWLLLSLYLVTFANFSYAQINTQPSANYQTQFDEVAQSFLNDTHETENIIQTINTDFSTNALESCVNELKIRLLPDLPIEKYNAEQKEILAKINLWAESQKNITKESWFRELVVHYHIELYRKYLTLEEMEAVQHNFKTNKPINDFYATPIGKVVKSKVQKMTGEQFDRTLPILAALRDRAIRESETKLLNDIIEQDGQKL